MARIATLLSPVVLACIALALPAAASAANCKNAELMPSRENVAQLNKATLCLLNAERRSRGLARLRSEGQLTKAAHLFSADMVSDRFFNHVSPSGSTLNSRVRRTSYLRGGVRRWSLGENLAWGAGKRATPRSIVDTWMKSPGHRANILDKRFRHVGVGVVIGAPQDVGSMPAATYTTDFGFRVAR